VRIIAASWHNSTPTSPLDASEKTSFIGFALAPS
jgi:hypothetical protein